MGAGNYQEYDDDDEGISLWAYSSPFRKLVYVALGLIPFMVLGFYISGIRHKQALAHQQFQQNIQRSQIYTPARSSKITTVSKVNSTPAYQVVAAPLTGGLDDYPMVTPWFANTINPNAATPSTGFDGYYFDTKQPHLLLHKNNTQSIFLDYNFYRKTPIHTGTSLGAYWVGNLVVSRDGLYEISGDLDDSNVQIFINRRLITENKEKISEFPTKQVFLKQGSYVLEVEYQNRFHQPNFSMTVGVPIKTYRLGDELRDAIRALNLPINTKLYLAAVRESSNPDHSVSVFANLPDPYVLMVHSTEVVHWKIDGATPPRAIIFNNDSTVASVGMPILLKTNATGIAYYHAYTNRFPSCTSCDNGRLMCGTVSLESKLEDFKQSMGMPLTGSTGGITASTLALPNITFDEAMLQTYTNAYARNVAECSQTGRVTPKTLNY